MNMIPFESNSLPAYINKDTASKYNEELLSHAGSGFPVISIKGKVFAVVRDGDRKVLTKDVDGEQIPSPSIDVVIIKANKNTSKVFYLKGFQEGAENLKPDCFSNDGIAPDATLEKPQASKCALCPNNQWGSKITETSSKGKACSDAVRIAVATPDQVNDPYLLRVPPASIRALGEYGALVSKRCGAAFPMLVTRIGFDVEAATPKLTFKAMGYLPPDVFAQVEEMRESEVVASILGKSGDAGYAQVAPSVQVEAVVAKAAATSKLEVSKDKQVKDEEVAAAVAAAERETAPKKKKEEVADIELSMDGIDLDDLSFD